jgi:hypothetical protein
VDGVCSCPNNNDACVSLAFGEWGIENVDNASLGSQASSLSAYSPTDCSNYCQPLNAAYYSPFEFAFNNLIVYICYCYSSAYVYTRQQLSMITIAP